MSCLYYIPILTNPDCSFIAQKKVFQNMKPEEVMGVMWLVPWKIKGNNCLDIINKYANPFNINTPVFPDKAQQARIRSQKQTFSQDIR